MSVIGIQLDTQNPEFTKCDFSLWMPQFKQFLATQEGDKYFEKLYKLANSKIFYSIFGCDWELAMSYCIAHYLTLIAQQQQAPVGNTLQEISGGGTTKGVLSSMTVGSFSKSYDLGKTMLDEDEAMFWNQTSYGTSLMALLKTKAIPSIFVVTSGPIPGAD